MNKLYSSISICTAFADHLGQLFLITLQAEDDYGLSKQSEPRYIRAGKYWNMKYIANYSELESISLRILLINFFWLVYYFEFILLYSSHIKAKDLLLILACRWCDKEITSIKLLKGCLLEFICIRCICFGRSSACHNYLDSSHCWRLGKDF